MDVNNLRRMAEKAASGGGQLRMDDLDDLTLEDENFTVKTLSQSTARKFYFFLVEGKKEEKC